MPVRMSESASPLYRCRTCKSTLVNARNLVVLIDGTSNKPGDENTNVVKLHDAVSDGDGSNVKQSKLYLKGIGAYDVDKLSPLSHVSKEIHSRLEMAFAWNVEENVIEAYEWLAKNYQEGDQIYLFGFSRGAYQVRALATIIHEVGLVKGTELQQSKEAYLTYRSINLGDPETRKTAIKFKKEFCRQGVRIHFVGVWDTVSSLGLIKQDVHITASASVTNACHFRHALALDERRVKFMPEYFSEVNANHIEIESPRSPVSDVQEVWFAGCHSDVGGTSRPQTDLAVDEHNPVHAGNVPLLWMGREAAAKGLVLKLRGFTWCPEDVDLGREDSMSLGWRFFEAWPVRHQVSFSGTGKHARRWHLSRPRSVIPHQHVHPSILSGDVYMPRATLRDGVGIPTVSRITSGGLWATELSDEEATTRFLTPLLHDPQTAMESLKNVSFLLSILLDEGKTQPMTDQRFEEFIGKQFDFARFSLAVIYDAASDFSISEELLRKARNSLSAILSSPYQSYFPGTLDVLRFSSRHEALRRRFIAHEEVIGALLRVLEERDDLFPLVMDILCDLIRDDDQRGGVINQLNARSTLSKAGKTRLSLVLEVKAPSQLTASLKMIASLAQYHPFLCKQLKPRIIELAKKKRSLVGSAAVEALVALNGPLPCDIPFSNILGYLGNTLPQLDVEGGSTSSPDATAALPPVFQVDDSGKLHKEDKVMRELVRTIESRGAQQRTMATLTFLKLCRCRPPNSPVDIVHHKLDSTVGDFYLQKVWDVFMRQLEKKETSLLAAYALKTCLGYDKWTPDKFDLAAELIVAMFDKGWFDDAIGHVEGSEVLRGLMTSEDLRREVIEIGIVTTLIKKLEGGECHDVRMGLICLSILEEAESSAKNAEPLVEKEDHVISELTKFVCKSLAYLQVENKKTQTKGVKVLSALAQTKVGEKAIELYVTNIVTMLLPNAGQSHMPRSQLFGPTAALYNLCRNETLRKVIKDSDQYRNFKRQRRESALYPKPDPGWEIDDHPAEPTFSHTVAS